MHPLRERTRRFVFAPAIAIALLGPAPAARAQDEPPLADAASSALASAAPTRFDGLLLAAQSALIKSKYTERVEAVAVSVGALVREGQPLLRLFDDEAKARKERAEAVLAQAAAKRERLGTLHTEEGVSDDEMEAAEAAARIAQVDFDLARILLDERSIRAPFDGVVAERYVDPGASVEVGDPLLKITALSPLRVEALLPEETLPLLSREAMAEVILAFPDTTLLVPVRLGHVVVDPASGTFPLQIAIDNRENRLTPGVTCTVAILPRQSP